MNNFFSKSSLEKYCEDLIEKSYSHKYLRKIPDGKGGWHYIYKEDFARPISTLLKIFGIKEDKIDSAYEKNSIEKIYGADKKTFAAHLLEYLSNRQVWNKYFSKKENRDKTKNPVKTKKAENKKTGSKDKKENQNKNEWNHTLMRKIYSMYNNVPEDKENTVEASKIQVGMDVTVDGKKGKVTKDYYNGLYFVNFEDGSMGRIKAADIIPETETEKHQNRSEAMMGNDNAKKDGIPEGWKVITGNNSNIDTNVYHFDESTLIGVTDPKEKAQAMFNDALVYLARGFGFDSEMATNLLMTLGNPNWENARNNMDGTIPDNIRESVLKELWSSAMTSKNRSYREFYEQIKNGETPELLYNLYSAVNEIHYQKADGSNKKNKNTVIGGYNLEPNDYDYIMNTIKTTYGVFQQVNQGKNGALEWNDAMFNFVMATAIKAKPNLMKDITAFAAKYEIDKIADFLVAAKHEFDSTIKNGLDSSVTPASEFKRDLFDDKGKQIPLQYSDITSGLSPEEKEQIHAEVREISDKNGYGISGEDLERYTMMWQEAIRKDTVHDQNMSLYKIFSILEDSNWHTEGQMLLDGKFADVLKLANKQKREERVWKERNGILERIKDNKNVGDEYFNNLIKQAENDEEIDAVNEAWKQYKEDRSMEEYRIKSNRREKYKKDYAAARKNYQENDDIQNLQQAEDALKKELKDWNYSDDELWNNIENTDNFDAKKQAKIDYLKEKIKGYNSTKNYGNTFPAAIAGNLPDGITIESIIEGSKGKDAHDYMTKLYMEKTGYSFWGGSGPRDSQREKWDNVQEIARLQGFKDRGFEVEDGKVVSKVKDANGLPVKEGDIINVSNSFASSDNGLWRVQKFNDGDNGTGFWLHKVKKDGSESQGKYTTNSWPMNHTYSSNYEYRRNYAEHNGKNGENVKLELYTVDPGAKEKAAKVTPKYQFTMNGIRTPEGKYTSVHYGLNDDGSVYVSSYDYGSNLRFLATETDKIQNDSDLMTDYHDKDSITVTASNPYYSQIKRAALKDKISTMKKKYEDAQNDVKKYSGEGKKYYNSEYYLKTAKEVVSSYPAQIKDYESQLKKVEKDLKGTVKKSLPMFIFKDGRFLIRK